MVSVKLVFGTGTCESAVFVRIEYRIESGITIRIRIESGIESAIIIPGGPKKRYPSFNFAITSANVHRFYPFFTVRTRNLWHIKEYYDFHLTCIL